MTNTPQPTGNGDASKEPFEVFYQDTDSYTGIEDRAGNKYIISTYRVYTSTNFGNFIPIHNYQDALTLYLAKLGYKWTKIIQHEIYHDCNRCTITFRVTLLSQSI